MDAKPKPLRWDALGKDERTALQVLAERIARREAKRMREVYGEHVRGVGVGFRAKGKQQRVYRELVIRFTVERKWRGGEGQGTAVPPHFTGKITMGGKKVDRTIPTDVVELKRFELQARTRLSIKFEMNREKASICCLLRDRDSKDLFMLSCNHVFGVIHHTALCQGTTKAQIDLRNPDHILVAHVARSGDLASTFPDTQLYSLDAAIAQIDDPNAVSSCINGKIATGIAASVGIGDKVYIPAASAALRGTVVHVATDSWVPYRCGANPGVRPQHRLFFPTIIEYKTVGANPKGGDSGSAVLLDDGRLLGMHFGLANGRGHAMLVKDIIKDTTFGRQLELVSDHRV